MIRHFSSKAPVSAVSPLALLQGALLISTLFSIASHDPSALAITINMEYSDEGDPLPHDENPSWDPDGSILKAHFEAAKAVWERLLPGEGEYSFDFQWDNDIEGLGLATDTPLDTYIEINPNHDWFADPTPGDSAEFNAAVGRVYSDLSNTNQLTYFPGSAPPGSLEVSFRATGIATSPTLSTLSLSGQTTTSGTSPPTLVPVDASNGYDLFSTVLHEIGHILGISGVEPGQYNIDPQHVGGIGGVLVLEGEGGHLGGHFEGPANAEVSVPGYLMCDGCGVPGVRRSATATDVLVIAEDQGITDVRLDRVDRISTGLWDDANGWIGGDVPDETQDVTIRHGGGVALGSNSRVKNLTVFSGNSVLLDSIELSAVGTLNFGDATVTIPTQGAIAADAIVADPAKIIASTGSRMQFNSFARAATSAATAIAFNGDVEIGYETETPGPVTFDPGPLANWNIAGDLTVGQARGATLLVHDGAWAVHGDVAVGGGADAARMEINSAGALSVTGGIFVRHNGSMIYRVDAFADSDSTYHLQGGETNLVDSPPPASDYLTYTPAGHLAFDDSASAVMATIDVGGGAGDNGPNASLTFRGSSTADDATITNRGGRSGQSLPYYETSAGLGGETRFEGFARARRAQIRNEGTGNDHGGTGGRTVFAGRSEADNAEIENLGSEWTLHYNENAGGRTEFLDQASADDAKIVNRVGAAAIGVSAGGHTIFRGQSTAGTAEITNLSGTQAFGDSGETHFRDASNAGDADVFNGGSAVNRTFGTTRFYDTASAANADVMLHFGSGGGGQAEFNGHSTAGNANFIFEGAPPAPANGWGGRVYFNDNSSAGTAEFIIQPEVRYSVLWFDDQSTAGDASFVMQDRSGARIDFFGNSDMGTADFDLGRNSQLWITEYASAENAQMTVRGSASVYARGYFNPDEPPTVSLGAAQIHVLGATEPLISSLYGGHLGLEYNAGGGTANIVVEGGTVPNAYGGTFNVDYGSLEAATLTVNGGAPGAHGGRASFTRGGDGAHARVTANAGARVDVISRADSYGDTQIGFLSGAGALGIADLAHLIVGGLDEDMTLAGPITTVSGWGANGGRLTKVGAGTLTIAGANTYRGVTTVDEGTLAFNGSMPGNLVVNGGGALQGAGVVGGSVTIGAGARLAPGTSAGAITVGSLQLSAGSILDFDVGPVSDRILLTGNGQVTLGGALDVSLAPGFTPTLGQTFPLLGGAIGSVGGAFQSVIAPVFNGLTFEVQQTPNSAMLQVVAAAGLPGDFNGDNVVDGSDLAQWKADFGVNGHSDSDGDGDSDGADFLTWQRQLGQGAPSAALTDAVPEPVSLSLLINGALICAALARRTQKEREIQ